MFAQTCSISLCNLLKLYYVFHALRHTQYPDYLRLLARSTSIHQQFLYITCQIKFFIRLANFWRNRYFRKLLLSKWCNVVYLIRNYWRFSESSRITKYYNYYNIVTYEILKCVNYYYYSWKWIKNVKTIRRGTYIIMTWKKRVQLKHFLCVTSLQIVFEEVVQVKKPM